MNEVLRSRITGRAMRWVVRVRESSSSTCPRCGG